ncbi:MAG: phosphoglycerate mutase family protein, partial [Candidatus Aminicenantes bacterium]|nr:phosphoglycerate mutase family protein [Candidatus Aminicenantes bacterium]
MMRPKRIILVRHGNSEGNADRERYAIIPDHSLNLTPEGEQQALNAG